MYTQAYTACTHRTYSYSTCAQNMHAHTCTHADKIQSTYVHTAQNTHAHTENMHIHTQHIVHTYPCLAFSSEVTEFRGIK
jgi:hypothetical protein